jgi:gliding motility-associated-like protein
VQLLAFSQNAEIVTLISGDSLVYYSTKDNNYVSYALSNSNIQNEVARSMEYNPDSCEFYVITSFRYKPNIYRISKTGNVSLIGQLTMNDGRSLYSCEAIAYNEEDKKLYGSVSFSDLDYYTESLVTIDIQTAICTEIAILNSSTPADDDMDFLAFNNGNLIIGDGDNTPFYYILSQDITSLQNPFTPDQLYYTNAVTASNQQELAVINGYVYVERNKVLYTANLASTPLTFVQDATLSIPNLLSPVRALASFPYLEIFTPPLANSDTTLCSGDSLLVGLNNYTNFIWDDGFPSKSRWISTAGQYTGTAQIGNCIFYSDTLKIDTTICITCNNRFQALIDSLDIGSDTVLCENDTIYYTLNITADSIIWSNGRRGKSVGLTTTENLSALIYRDSCTFSTNSILVEFIKCNRCSDYKKSLAPNLDLGEDFTQCNSITLDYNQLQPYVDRINWFDGDTSRTKTVNESSQIYFSIEIDTCTFFSDTLNLTILNCDSCKVEFPNAVTPNYDNLNDVFRPVFIGDCEYEITGFQVFNRWGEKLYDDTSAQWNGIFKGVPVQQDVYIYTISYKYLFDNSVHYYSGNIHIIY